MVAEAQILIRSHFVTLDFLVVAQYSAQSSMYIARTNKAIKQSQTIRTSSMHHHLRTARDLSNQQPG